MDGSGNVFVTGTSYVGPGFLSYDYATIAYSAAGAPLWTNRYNGPANDSDTASAIAVDGSGNVFVSGQSPGLGSDYDYATIKYSGTGVPVWTNRYNGPWYGADQVQALAVDDSGNVFVTGSSYGGGHPYDSYDYATIAYSGAGVALWTNRYTGPGDGLDAANAVAVDGSGNVLVTGGSWNGTAFNYASIKYSGAGLPMWTNSYTEAGYQDAAISLAVDGSGNVFVTGTSFNFTSSYDFATLKYSEAGDALWTNRYSGPMMNSDDQASAVTVDRSGNLFVTGSSYDNNSGSIDYATIKYSSAGVALWTNRCNGGRDDFVTALVADGNGNVIVTGYSENLNGSTDYLTVKYSGAGLALWTNRYNGPANLSDQARAVAVDSSGNVFVTGHSTGIESDFDYATIKYSAAGGPLWTNRYNGPANAQEEATAMLVDGSGNVIVTGASRGNGSDMDYATVKYSGAGVPLWTNRYNGLANNSDYATAVAADAGENIFVTGYSGYDYVTIKYSGAGLPLWTNRYDGPANSLDYAYAAAVDRYGNLFVAGASVGSDGVRADYATIAYSGAGVPLWTNRYNGPGNSDATARSVGVDGSGAVFVTGSAAGSGGGNADFTTVAYSGAGVPLWTNRYNGPANGDDFPRTKQSLAVGPDGSVYVTGASDGDYTDGVAHDFATVKYTGSLLLTIARTATNTAAISWSSGWVDFTLQENTNVGLANAWSPVLQPAATNAGRIAVTVPTSAGNKFFRLQSQ